MKTFFIYTLGCKVNQYEGQQIRELLERLGLRNRIAKRKIGRLGSRLDPPEKPDLVVVNTCCVTHTASAKSRQYIRKVRKFCPDAVVVVCGCLPTVHISESTRNPILQNSRKTGTHRTTENIHYVKKRGDLAEILSQIVIGPHAFLSKDSSRGDPNSPSCPNNTIKSENGPKIKHKNELCNYHKLSPLTSFDGQTRAFLKVQDGCDGYCTYCIVPKTRPIVHSRPVDAVLKEAQALVRSGYKEIVITGINLGAYGQESVRRAKWPNRQNNKLADLLDKIARIPNLTRIRLSSLEPADVTPQLLDVFCKHRNIMPHLHLSLQSGSDAVLKKMCRQYKADQIREKVDMIKSRLDRPAITTDIIVGFPGETDADFEQTVNLAEDIGFARMHVFRFSPRKGTAAAKMPDKVDNQVIKKRSVVLRELDIELGRKFRRQFIGESAEILIEGQNGRPGGRCKRYFMVDIYQKDISDLKYEIRNNDLVKVRLIKNNDSQMTGHVIFKKN